MADLGVLLGGRSSEAYDINDGGQVVGYSFVASSDYVHAFLFNNGAMADLGTLPGGLSSEAFGINAGGQVVGYSRVASGDEHAFLYSNGEMVDLNNLIDPALGVTLVQARDINDSGQIVGSGKYANGLEVAFLLTPTVVPEPGSVAVWSILTIVGIAMIRRRRRTQAA